MLLVMEELDVGVEKILLRNMDVLEAVLAGEWQLALCGGQW